MDDNVSDNRRKKAVNGKNENLNNNAAQQPKIPPSAHDNDKELDYQDYDFSQNRQQDR